LSVAFETHVPDLDSTFTVAFRYTEHEVALRADGWRFRTGRDGSSCNLYNGEH
jgi:hypothetical protein